MIKSTVDKTRLHLGCFLKSGVQRDHLEIFYELEVFKVLPVNLLKISCSKSIFFLFVQYFMLCLSGISVKISPAKVFISNCQSLYKSYCSRSFKHSIFHNIFQV